MAATDRTVEGDGRTLLPAGSAFRFTDAGLAELQRLTDDEAPRQVADWLPEMGVRLQGVDDSCLSAARHG